MIDFKSHIDSVPNFPSPGILFRDISPLLRDHFTETVEQLGTLVDTAEWRAIDLIAGIDSRGFILASALAILHRKGLVLVRKPGKLPPPVMAAKYTLEYGSGILEIKRGSGAVLVIDDVIATGGTMSTAGDLCAMAGYHVVGLAALVDLKLNPQCRIRGMEVRSLIQYG